MSHLATEIKPLKVKELLTDGSQYSIPIYQRNYAWTAKEIDQLLRDVIDYCVQYSDRKYYIGTLVVAEDSNNFSTIDGQQRLTTLFIAFCVIRNEFQSVDMSWFTTINLQFDIRKRSTETLKALFYGSFQREDLEVNMRNAYDLIKRNLPKICSELNISISKFIDYLKENVIILRVPLPQEIDLNHYFEVMNNRGEQLEKHEVLKARLMGVFNELDVDESIKNSYKNAFHFIWEACANMEGYVQMEFPVDVRHQLFGENNWDELVVYDFENVISILNIKRSEEGLVSKPLEVILSDEFNFKIENEKNSDIPDKFTSIINFPNFLLHVLRLQVVPSEVALDDKRLIDIFQDLLPKPIYERIEFVKVFAFNLLKAKFMFDKFIIKRNENANSWSLMSLRHYRSKEYQNSHNYINAFGTQDEGASENLNKRIIMLQSMFQVSNSSHAYKYWLNATLLFLMDRGEINGKEFSQYLEHIAKSFVFDHGLNNNPSSYDKIISNRMFSIKRDPKSIDWNNLKYPYCDRLIFNFTDYLLWCDRLSYNDKRVQNFEFTYRSSVEHYYPQNPMTDDLKSIDPLNLHSFGNLCLISHEKNSRLSNFSPHAKKDHYGKSDKIDSIKQFIMMSNPIEWDENSISSHNNDMIKLLSQNIQSDFYITNKTTIAQKWFKEYQIRDKTLLMRALLCFGDCKVNVKGNRYQIFDWAYIHSSDTFNLFEEYVQKHQPINLKEIISNHLNSNSLNSSWRYSFVKYPELLNYCFEGLIDFDNSPNFIHILKTKRRNNKSVIEIYGYCLKLWLYNEFETEIQYNSEEISVGLDLGDEGYELYKYSIPDLSLQFWNDGGEFINYQLYLDDSIHPNSLIIKNLEKNFKWNKKEKGIYVRKNDRYLFKLTDNIFENHLKFQKAFISLLKNGFGIKL